MLIGGLSAPFYLPGVYVLLLLLLPLVLDGGIQRITSYESTNRRRLVTGILFGYGLVGLLWISSAYTFSQGLSFGRMYFDR